MKQPSITNKLLFTIIFILGSYTFSFAQEEASNKSNETGEVFEVTDVCAAPKKSMKKFYKWLYENMKYPEQAKKMGVEGKVYVRFIVEKDGSLSNINVVIGIGSGCDEEAIRLMKSSEKWNPGKIKRKPVRQQLVLPISFYL